MHRTHLTTQGNSGQRARRGARAALALALTLGSTLLAALALPAASPAVAATETGKIVSDDPDNHTPHVLDGYVRTFAEVGNTVLVGGNFTSVRPADGDPTPVARDYIFAFDRTTGAILPFNTALNGEVFQILPTGDNQTVWVAGGFSSVNGQTVRGLVKLDVTTGARVTAFNPPAFGGRIHDMALRNGRLYLTGRFLTVGGKPRTLLAAVDPVTGKDIPEVDLTFTDPRRGSLTIYASDISPDGSSLIAIGNFTKVAGLNRYQIAKIDLTTPTPTVSAWNTNRYGNGCSTSFDSYMRDVAYSPDGSYFVVVTTGAYSSTFLCDAAARFDNNSTSSAAEPVWTNYTGGDTITAVAVTDAAVYVGGHFGWMNNPYVGDRIGNGAVVREGLAALDPRSGAVLGWDPTRTLGWGVYGFTTTDNGLWIGSDTDRVGKAQEFHGRLAFMPVNGGTVRATDYTGTLPGQTVTVATDASTVRTRAFTGTSVLSTATTSQNWSGLRGAFMLNGNLYTGWSDKTFRVQSYDGTTFGPRTTIPMTLVTAANPGGPGNPADSLNRFSSQDLNVMTAMFYEPLTGRIYFTRSGENRLYYRSFSQETQIVGAERQDGIAGFTGLDWRNVRGMFLVDNQLYIADTAGALTRWNWDPTGGPADTSNLSPAAYSGRPVAGTNTVISSPAKDNNNWNGLATFLYASTGAPNVAPTAVANVSCTTTLCEFDGTASTDSDGAIMSYVWDFGDGTTQGVGPTATHAYADAGTYVATLTVIDDEGAEHVASVEVTVSFANVAPVANLAATCEGLTCNVDATGSSDSDGSIAGYLWDFGDGATATDPTAGHDYAAAGTYTITLTVTDDQGATNTATQQVTVTDPNVVPAVGFVGADGTSVNSSVPAVTVPAEVAEGDTLLLFATSATITAATAPEGWTLVHSATNDAAGLKTSLWTKRATAADAGTRVVVGQGSQVKVAVQLVAYRGAAGVESFTQLFDTVQQLTRTTPLADVTAPGSMVVSYWADKSSATTGWQLPAEVALRTQAVGPGSGRVVAAVGDTGPLDPGPAGGYTATADSLNARGIVWTVVLATDLSVPNVPPTPAFASTCQHLTCTFDASASHDAEGPIAEYLWDFGDGTTGTGVAPTHPFAQAGTYPVTLTVVDAAGASAQTTREVVASNPPAAVVAYRASASVATTGGNPRVVVPAPVAAGDVMVMIVSVNSNTPTVTGPAGWTALGGVNHPTGMQTYAWWKVATAADLGRSVGPNLSATAKTTLQLSVYSNASTVSASAFIVDTATSATRTTPVVPVATGGSTLVSYWADKSATTTGWTTPAGTTLRELTVGSGSGRITSVLADSGSLGVGNVGGQTATADSVSGRGAVWSIVVAPA